MVASFTDVARGCNAGNAVSDDDDLFLRCQVRWFKARVPLFVLLSAVRPKLFGCARVRACSDFSEDGSGILSIFSGATAYSLPPIFHRGHAPKN